MGKIIDSDAVPISCEPKSYSLATGSCFSILAGVVEQRSRKGTGLANIPRAAPVTIAVGAMVKPRLASYTLAMATDKCISRIQLHEQSSRGKIRSHSCTMNNE